MKKLIISIGVPLLLCSTALWAQEKISSTWTLQDCFEYARDHSITLQQNRLSVEESEVNTKEAKAQLFPSFDFSTSHNYNNYPMADGSRSGKNVYTGTYGIDESKVLVPLPDKSTVYTTALGFVPSIQSGKLELEVAELNIANAKAGYYPNLSLNAGIGSGHNTGNNGSFGTQMKQGFNESVGLTLSVPIYSRRSNKSAVERAKIQQKISQLDLKNQEKDLLNQIENAWLDASSAQSKYLAAKEQLNATKTSYELTEEQFYLGMKNTVEMLTAKNNWLSAQQEELQSRFMALLNLKLLDYYENKPLTLD